MDATALTSTEFDSGTPRGLSAVFHAISEPGTYRLRSQSEQEIRFVRRIEVHDDAPPINRDENTVDLSSRVSPASVLELPTGSSLVIHSSGRAIGRGGAPLAAELAEADGRVRWTSTRLERGDLFAVVPLRPGTYELRDRERTTTLQVLYPDPRPSAGSDGDGALGVPLRPDDPFVEPPVLACGQGLILTATEGARFRLQLREPDDGPEDLAAWKAAHDRTLVARFSVTA